MVMARIVLMVLVAMLIELGLTIVVGVVPETSLAGVGKALGRTASCAGEPTMGPACGCQLLVGRLENVKFQV